MNDTNTITSLSCALSLSLLAGCTTDVVSLGEERLAQELEKASRCATGTVIEESVTVSNQMELDVLAGCEEIRGDLNIQFFDATDLSALASLRVVEGTFNLGVGSPRPQTSEEVQAEADRTAGIIAAGWLESLHGVEALERVGALRIRGVSAPDLTAFRSLVRLAGTSGSQPGALEVGLSPRFADLSGLEAVTGITQLAILDNPAIESLDGITIGTQLDSVTFRGNPRLSDVDALSKLNRVPGAVLINDTGLVDLNGFSQLIIAEQGLELRRNSELIDSSGLDFLAIADSISISDNPKLRRLPSFPQLVRNSSFRVENNAELESLEFDSPNLGPNNLIFQGKQVPRGADIILVANNPKLQSISSPHGFTVAGVLAVIGNQNLASLDFGTLERLELLSIENNPRLSQIGVGALAGVFTLEVIDNPSLATSTIAGVPSLVSTFSGNADQPAP
jgi:hypothetical protein